MSHRFYPLGVKRGPWGTNKKNLGTQWPRRTSPLCQEMTTRRDKGPATGLRYHHATWHLARATWKKQMFLSSFFFLQAAVLINNLSHTTTNPWANVGNTSLFPSLSFYHKHINICLTRVLRCTARPPGPHQAARIHKGHVKMWRGVPLP